MFGLGSLKIYAMIGVAVATMVAGFYWYYQDSQKRIMDLMANQAKLETAVAIQEATIKQQQEDMAKQAATLEKVNDAFAKAQADKQNLTDKLMKHDLGKLAEKKPGLVEEKINRGTENVGRCFEILSGAPLTDAERNATKKSEINNECPSIANPAYVPN
jgi:ATP/maltotriose-dependent transcriptional regulator MalT